MRWLFALLILIAAPAQAQTVSPALPHRMIVASHPLAADAGLAVLYDGGTAADAAIAAALVLAVVAPDSSALGGGGFALSFTAEGRKLESWNGREAAPAAAGPDLFLRRDGTPMSRDEAGLGGRAVGVPGLLRLLEALHTAHGRLGWDRLFAPAIQFADGGFPLSPPVAAAMAADADALRRMTAARGVLLAADGSVWPAGQLASNHRLADTLRAVAQGGADLFYRGEIAAEMATAVRGDGNAGLLTTDDLAAYQVKPRPALCRRYREVRVCGMGPPSSGGVSVLEDLGLLEHFPLAAFAPDGADVAQLLIEAGKLTEADRALYLADDAFGPVPVRGLLSGAYLTARAQGIDLDHANPAPRAGNPSWRGPRLAPAATLPEHGTSQVDVVDGDGNAVSLTASLQDPFGAHLMVGGVLLNDALTDFSFVPAVRGRLVANRVAGGKRPRSAMAPTLVLGGDGGLRLVLGAQGGARIPGVIVQSLVRLLDFQQAPEQAVGGPLVLTLGTVAELEAGGLAEALTARGQTVVVQPIDAGALAIAVTQAGLRGAADPRHEGIALGE